MDTARTVKVASERERDYFRRLGQWEAENFAERLRMHLSQPLEERIRAASRFCQQVVRDPDPDEDDSGALYERARRLGLYRA